MSILDQQVRSQSSSDGRSIINEITKHKVLKNTYMLLALTLLFTAVTAAVSVSLALPRFGILITLGGYFGLLFLTNRLKNSVWGLASVFALTGFMGYTLGPIINLYTSHFVNGSQLVMTSLAGTGIIFFALSGYVLTTRKDMSYLGGFLLVATVIAFLGGIGSMFFNIPMLNLGISALFMLVSSGLIMLETSQIIHGGQTNYVLATVTLYVSLYNLFLSLLHILSSFSGQSRD